MPCELEDVQANACASDFGKVQDPVKLLQLIAQLLCDLSTGGFIGAALDVTGDPNGVLTANHNQFAWDSTNKVLWVHEGADGTDTGWWQIV